MASLARFLVFLIIALFLAVVLILGTYLPESGSVREMHAHPAQSGHTSAAPAKYGRPRLPRLPRCPVPEIQPDLHHEDYGRQCRFAIRNQQMDNAELLFVTGEGDERRYFIVDYNSSLSVSSYTGDLWRLRSRRGLLLKEFRTPACTGSITLPEIVLPPCAPPTLDPPQALGAPAEVASNEFGAARFRECGSELVLSVDRPSPGMHLLCLVGLSSTPGAALAVAVFAHGLRGGPVGDTPVPTDIFLVPQSSNPNTLRAAPTDSEDSSAYARVQPDTLVALTLSMVERLQHPPPHQPAALFSLSGARISSGDAIALAASRRQGLLLFEGGQWLWPAAAIGQEHVVHVQPKGEAASTGLRGGSHPPVRLRVISIKPRVVQVEDFLTEQEVEHIVGLSAGHMFTSGVSMKDEDARAGHRADEYRTSSQHSLRPSQTDTLLALSRRVQLLTRLPATHVEQIQVLRYLEGQH